MIRFLGKFKRGKTGCNESGRDGYGFECFVYVGRWLICRSFANFAVENVVVVVVLLEVDGETFL